MDQSVEYFLEIIKMIFKACKDIFLTSFEHFGSFKDALEKYTLTWLNIPVLDREIYFTTMSKKLDPGNISRLLFAFFFFLDISRVRENLYKRAIHFGVVVFVVVVVHPKIEFADLRNI